MMSILLILNTCVAVALVILILLQKTDPASGGMFGGAGGGGGAVVRNPLAKPTAILAAAFIGLSLLMAYVNKGGEHKAESVMADVEHSAPAGNLTGMTPEVPDLTPDMLNVTPTAPATELSVSPVPEITVVVSPTTN